MNYKFRLFLILITCVLSTFTHLKGGEPKLMQSQVKGLLVIELPNNGFAGGATQMNATAVPLDENESFDLRFNQRVGEMMYSATEEVEKLTRIRHGKDLPSGHRIEFGFADKHTMKDGPSAAVACAMMVESIITGEEIQPSFAVTGDITATGEVRPVGGIVGKVRGAAKRDCKVMAVPIGNKADIHDIYVLEGINSIVATQIILIENFDQAWQVGRGERSEKIRKALDDYEMVQAAITRAPASISHPQVREKLKSIVGVIPNHESARLIALHSIGKGPKRLSLTGSIQSIQGAAKELGTSIESGNYQERGVNSPLWESVSLFNRLRDSVDPRTKDYLNAFLKATTLLKDITASGRKQWTPEQQREWNSVIARIQGEESKLINNVEIQEELMDQ
jgi:hypothetical protein